MFRKINRWSLPGMALFGLAWGAVPLAVADEHCGDLGDCRVLIEINASDGDAGFHALFDGDAWVTATMTGPLGTLILEDTAMDEASGGAQLATQGVTENFFESAEPSCEDVDLSTFLDRFPMGNYGFTLDDAEGNTTLTHAIPAAPADVEFNGKDITWSYGDDHGECSDENVDVLPEGGIVAYEVVMEPDVDDPVISNLKFTIRVPASVNKVRVPKDYLASLPPNISLKAEVGAIEHRTETIDGTPVNPYGNQTFTEEDGFCNNPSQTQCEEDEEEEE